VFLFKCYWYDTTDRGIRVDPQYGLVEINSKARLRNVNDVFVFAKQCQQVYCTYKSGLVVRFKNETHGSCRACSGWERRHKCVR
jgi:hypothetical protein